MAESWNGGKAEVIPMEVQRPDSALKEKTEALWKFLRLSPVQRVSPIALLHAKAWARLADSQPQARDAVALIDETLESIVQEQLRARAAQRLRVDGEMAKYMGGMATLGELIDALTDIDCQES